MQFIKEQGNGYALSVFQSWGNWSHDDAFDEGEYAIFSLPDFREYDGIVVDLTNITNRQVHDRLVSSIVESGLPAISVCNPAEGLTSIRSDNRAATRELFEHLWNEHGCRSFAFAGSRKSDLESAEREETFITCCKEHGVTVTPDMLTEQDYTAQTGVLAAKGYFANGSDTPVRPLPDAFVCANDNIAVGLCSEMKKHGFLCPRDFRVTGFDNLDKAMYYKPQITTVSIKREYIAHEAAMWLARMMDGDKVPKDIYLPVELIYTESCGCPNSGLVDYREYLSWQVEDSIFSSDLAEALTMFSMELQPQLSIDELMHHVLWKFADMDLDGVYICLDERLDTGVLASGYYDSGRLVPNACCERGEDGAMHEVSYATADELHEHLLSHAENSALFFFPLHMDDRIAGFIVFRNPRMLVVNWRIYDLIAAIQLALKEWDENRKLSKSLAELRKVYDRDQLTGMYSKSAFNSRLLPWFRKGLSRGEHIAVLFMDVDHFKQINDTYGHDYGDFVLQRAAGVILRTAPKESFTFRYGGDEFVMVFRVQSQEEGEKVRNALTENLLAADTKISIGLSMTKDGDFPGVNPLLVRASLDRCIREADRDMYRQKKIHHSAGKV